MGLTEEQLIAKLRSMDEDELRKMANDLSEASKSETDSDRPKTDDELHAWILKAVGIDIPRVAASPDTNAPFEWFSDLFFGRVSSALVVASRGSGKSFLAALFNFTMCYWWKENQCMSVAAIKEQAKTVYDHVRSFQNIASSRLKVELVRPGDSQQSFTRYTNNSRYKIVASSRSSVNGPHDPIVHRDEIELMDEDVYRESLNIEKSKKNSDGEVITVRTLITSTRKTSDGLVQKIIDLCEIAEKNGEKPPFKIYWTNVYDVAENQAPGPDGRYCRIAYPDLPEEQKCECDQYISGEWEEDNPRRFSDVCGGKLANAQGFSPIDDARGIFMTSPQNLWEAQQENKRPYVEDVSIPEFSVERHGIRDFEPDPEQGKIFCAIDFGGTHPFGISYVQVLDHEIEAKNHANVPIRVPEGTRVMFKEIYQGEIGNSDAFELIKNYEDQQRLKWPNWMVNYRFGDLAAKSARLDFGKWGMPTQWPARTRDKEVHLERLRTAVQKDIFRVVLGETEVFVEQVSVWHIEGKKVFDDMMDSVLYNNSNIYAVTEKGAGKKVAPSHKERDYNTRQGNPFADRIGIRVNRNEIGGMSAQGWLDQSRRSRI